MEAFRARTINISRIDHVVKKYPGNQEYLGFESICNKIYNPEILKDKKKHGKLDLLMIWNKHIKCYHCLHYKKGLSNLVDSYHEERFI